MNKNIMRSVGFNKKVEAAENGECPFCHKPIKLKDFFEDR